MPKDKKQRSNETHRGDTHAAPMVDDTNMSTHDTNETVASDEVADAEAEASGQEAGMETGIMHAPIASPGHVGTPAGSYAVLGGGFGRGAGIYPVDLDPTDDTTSTVGNDISPEQRGLRAGQDQDRFDADDRDVPDRN